MKSNFTKRKVGFFYKNNVKLSLHFVKKSIQYNREVVNLTILNRVKELRARFNFSQSVLAEKVGVTRQTIAAIEKGDYVPSLLLALTICDVFELKMEDVFVLNKEGGRG